GTPGVGCWRCGRKCTEEFSKVQQRALMTLTDRSPLIRSGHWGTSSDAADRIFPSVTALGPPVARERRPLQDLMQGGPAGRLCRPPGPGGSTSGKSRTLYREYALLLLMRTFDRDGFPASDVNLFTF